jgi:hypothetical protein
VEDTGKRILVFFWLGQYNNPDAKVIELEQQNVRKATILAAARRCYHQLPCARFRCLIHAANERRLP